MTTTPDLVSSEGQAPAAWIRRLPWMRLVAEFGVIFLGITLSLMADDWRLSRVDRETERQSLQELFADLEAESSNLESFRDETATHDRDATWLFHRLGDARTDVDSALVRIQSLHSAVGFEAPSAAYEGIRSTGRLGLIRDDALRRQIVEYYEEVQPDLLGLYEAYGDIWFAFTEALAADLQYTPNGETFFGGRGFQLTRPWPDVPTDPMLRFRLSTMGVLAAVLSNGAKQVLGQNADLRDSIRAFLES
jgi:hypothetical protein